MSHQILIVDDDPHIAEVLSFALHKAGMTTVLAANGIEALRQVEAHKPDLIILDINMPRMDGLETCRRLRVDQHLPIIFLSSRDDEIDRILGLELGGDDYVVKPFSPREVVARVKAILKRAHGAGGRDTAIEDSASLSHENLTLDLDAYTASWLQTTVALTATEFHLLKTLARHPKKVFTRDQLMDGAYGGGIAVSDRTIDSHIRHIRTKFADARGSDVIDTVHGIGYKMGNCQGEQATAKEAARDETYSGNSD